MGMPVHSFGEVHNYSKSFIFGEQWKSPTPGEVLLALNNRLEISNGSTIIMKIKKQNLSYFNSVILCDHLEFLFVFQI